MMAIHHFEQIQYGGREETLMLYAFVWSSFIKWTTKSQQHIIATVQNTKELGYRLWILRVNQLAIVEHTYDLVNALNDQYRMLLQLAFVDAVAFKAQLDVQCFQHRTI